MHPIVHTKEHYFTNICKHCGGETYQVYKHERIATFICKKCNKTSKKEVELIRSKKYSMPEYVNTTIPDYFLKRHKQTKVYFVVAYLEYEHNKNTYIKRLVKSTNTKNIVDAILIRNKMLEPIFTGYYIAI